MGTVASPSRSMVVAYSFFDPPIIQPSQPLLVCSTFCVAFSAVLSSGPPTIGVDGDVDDGKLCLASCTASTMPTPFPPVISCFLSSSTANLLCSAISLSSFHSPCIHQSNRDGAFLSALFFCMSTSSSAIPETSALWAAVAVPCATASRAFSRMRACVRSSSAK
jgi:hypothetical protein